MVMLGWSVHLTTFFFLGKFDQADDQYSVHIPSLVTDNNPSYISGRGKKGGRSIHSVGIAD